MLPFLLLMHIILLSYQGRDLVITLQDSYLGSFACARRGRGLYSFKLKEDISCITA